MFEEHYRRRIGRGSSSRFGEKKRTITRTFRIRKKWDDVLKEEADRLGLSVNVLVNRIFRRYALHARWTDKRGDVSFLQQTLREILERVPDESLVIAGAECGPSDIRDILSMMGLDTDYDSLRYIVTEQLGGPSFARWFHCFHSILKDEEVFHLRHSLGHKWSTYLERYIISSLESLVDVNVESRIDDYAVTFRVKNPRYKKR